MTSDLAEDAPHRRGRLAPLLMALLAVGLGFVLNTLIAKVTSHYKKYGIIEPLSSSIQVVLETPWWAWYAVLWLPLAAGIGSHLYVRDDRHHHLILAAVAVVTALLVTTVCLVLAAPLIEIMNHLW